MQHVNEAVLMNDQRFDNGRTDILPKRARLEFVERMRTESIRVAK